RGGGDGGGDGSERWGALCGVGDGGRGNTRRGTWAGGRGSFRLESPGRAASRGRSAKHLTSRSRRRRLLRSRSELRWVGLILAVLGLAVGGCGTFSGGGNSSSALLASASVPAGPFPRATAESAQLSVPEPVAAA